MRCRCVGSPSAADIWLPTAATGEPADGTWNDWHTVLIGGMRQGGRAIWALDVTNPGAISESAASATNTVMWEFSSDDDADFDELVLRDALLNEVDRVEWDGGPAFPEAGKSGEVARDTIPTYAYNWIHQSGRRAFASANHDCIVACGRNCSTAASPARPASLFLLK